MADRLLDTIFYTAWPYTSYFKLFLFKFHHWYDFDILVETIQAKVVFDKVNFNFSIGSSST
jgi:hypothetical protein